MDWKLEVVTIPVSDMDRAKTFYAEQIGFNVDIDHQVTGDLRLLQLTPPGSSCSIHLGPGTEQLKPGSLEGLFLVVSDVKAASEDLVPFFCFAAGGRRRFELRGAMDPGG